MKKLLALLLGTVMVLAVVCLAACAGAGAVVTFRTKTERKLGEKEAVKGVVDPTGVGGTPEEGWMFRWETGERKTNDKGEESLVLSGEAFDFNNVTEDVTVYQRIVPQPGIGRYFVTGALSEGGPVWKPDKLEEGNEWLMDYDEANDVYTQTIKMAPNGKGGFRVLDNTGEWNSLYNGTHVTEVTIADDVTCADYYPEIAMGKSGEDVLFYTGAATDSNVELNVAITSITIVVTVDVLNNAMKLHITELTIPDPSAGPSVFGTAVVGDIFGGACGGTWFGSAAKADLEAGIFAVDDDGVATGTIQVVNGNVFKIMKDTKVGWGTPGTDNFGFNAESVVTFADGVEEITGFLSDKDGNNLVTMTEGKVATVVVTVTKDMTISYEVTAINEYILVGSVEIGGLTHFDNEDTTKTLVDADGELVEWTLTEVGIFKIMSDNSDWSTALGFAYNHEVVLADGVEYPEGTTADTFLTDDGNFKMGIEGYTTVFTIDFDMAGNCITINIVSITAIAA